MNLLVYALTKKKPLQHVKGLNHINHKTSTLMLRDLIFSGKTVRFCLFDFVREKQF